MDSQSKALWEVPQGWFMVEVPYILTVNRTAM
jgi:hypothetical protein